MKRKILILEDDPGMRKTIKVLIPSDFACDESSRVSEALELYQKNIYSLVIADLHLEDGTGFKLIEKINQLPGRKSKIIVLTASDLESDEAKCHEMDVTEFIQKPIRPLALKAQIEKNINFIISEEAEQKTLGYLKIYPRKSQVKLIVHGKEEDLLLTLKEFILFMKFLDNPGITLTREQLFTDVWDAHSAVKSRTVDMHVSALRKKLGKYGDAISSVRGCGYRFVEDKLL